MKWVKNGITRYKSYLSGIDITWDPAVSKMWIEVTDYHTGVNCIDLQEFPRGVDKSKMKGGIEESSEKIPDQRQRTCFHWSKTFLGGALTGLAVTLGCFYIFKIGGRPKADNNCSRFVDVFLKGPLRG